MHEVILSPVVVMDCLFVDSICEKMVQLEECCCQEHWKELGLISVLNRE